MKRRKGKVGRTTLILFALSALILFLLETQTKRKERSSSYEKKVEAGNLAQKCFEVVREERVSLGLGIDSINDPNYSGLIGSANSLITVGRRDLEEVLLTTAPNLASFFVAVLEKTRAQEGETIAVSLDGSFPGANISFFCAAKVLGLSLFPIGSLTSSSWGANNPAFSYFDMERILSERALLPYRTLFASLGGEDDGGRGLSEFAREILAKNSLRNGIALIEGESLSQRKLSLYPPRARILVNIGNCQSASFLLAEAKRRKKQVFDFSSPRKVFSDVGVTTKDLFSPIGKGLLFEEERYSVFWAVVFSGIILVALFFVITYDIEFYLLPKREREKIKEEEAI